MRISASPAARDHCRRDSRASSAARAASRSHRSSKADPAERAGLRAEDLIVELAGTPIEGMDDLQRVVVNELIGRAVPTRVIRGGREQELELVPAELEG